mmetsp:Transcript_55957/g.124926  ORF Transcript_55957/g.124926 Transcript_55957/m.124926 type:complete len:222 (-) Transcript_55957:27-692(-)
MHQQPQRAASHLPILLLKLPKLPHALGGNAGATHFKEGLRTCPRPCTWRCKCKGCTNPTPFPPPQNLSALELQTLPLPDIIARLTPRDIEYFASQHGCLLHYATMLKLCDPDVASNCWYCSRYGQRLLPISLQRHFLPLYPTVGSDGTFTPFAKRWEETLANKGQAYISDESLVSRNNHLCCICTASGDSKGRTAGCIGRIPGEANFAGTQKRPCALQEAQ